MPIRINLLAEAQAAEEMRRNDPVKRGAWIAAFLVFCVALWGFNIQLEISQAQRNFNNAASLWKQKEANYMAVTNNQARTWQVERKLVELDRLTTNRFLWAPVLNALQKSAINDVSLTHLHGDQGYSVEESRMAGKVPIPGGVTEHIKLTLEARDNNPPETSYNKYKESLNLSDYFVKHIGRKDGFVIEGTLSAVTVDPADPSKQFLTFTLASHFPETRRSE